jgi:hypothetical protein
MNIDIGGAKGNDTPKYEWKNLDNRTKNCDYVYDLMMAKLITIIHHMHSIIPR